MPKVWKVLRELPTAGCPQRGACQCSHPQLEFGMLPWPLSLPGSSSSELPRWALPGTEISCLPLHPGEEEQEWVDGAHGAG